MLLRIKKGYFLGGKRPVYRVFAASRYQYKVARASLKNPKSHQKFWYPKSCFTRI